MDEIMKQPKKTCIGSAVFFELSADDGWPDDAGWWPLGGCNLRLDNCSYERIQRPGRLSPSRFLKSLLRYRNRS